MDAVEGSGEVEEVVDAEGGEGGGVEGAVVDEATGFVDDEERVDDPSLRSVLR